MSKQKSVIGIIGVGKLGCPIAVSIAYKGFKVLAHDVNPNLMKKQVWPHRECGPDGATRDFQKYLDQADITYLPLREVVEKSDIVFVVVQTPHLPQYEGSTRLPFSRADFNYQYLKEACANVAKYAGHQKCVVVCSTVLPGTMRRDIIPLLPNCLYNPAFPAMGTAMRDYLNPEFVLIGRGEGNSHLHTLKGFYRTLLGEDGHCEASCTPIMEVSIESAELAKVAYNCLVTMKVTAATTFQEISHHIPHCNVDEVSDVLSKAWRRVCSPAYLRGGVQDGGSCHPRDNIAMSWLAEKLKLSSNIFDKLMEIREQQTEWLAHMLKVLGEGMPKAVLGKAYKAESEITTGSAAMLIANILHEWEVDFEHYDPYVLDDSSIKVIDGSIPKAFLIATQHQCFTKYQFPQGSIVIDPFRYIPQQKGVKLIQVGVGK